MREYSSFEQIEHDLKILKLKRQISEEEVRLNVNGAKNGMSSGFSPVSSLGTLVGSLLQKAVVAKLLSTIFGYKRVKEVNREGEYKA
ncbi:hypothetical protein JM84_0485 [Dokdonia sp. Hel_I_63]|jgi:hypothetical protein|uniref:DUF6327 family protein n=1 Tax=unclassified Dokdonia TaxID=2615033 RepID=UPI00020A713E|nr:MULTISPECIES: DUF6327 family protein [unclassified Dokdonia]AEE19152.1 glutaminyl-tRNA synthetase [Dokdonia sp. 4H-3-7-5]AWH73749.1 hypothetical protein DCS32_06140 [Dokdonia sp. Dokd-P16]TVZ21611.1 hypothetical protein JM84_0485 [Dokdonia sp. Hel_I_63]